MVYGGTGMKEKMKRMMRKFKLANVLAICAMGITVAVANQCCVLIYHQPEMPEELKRLRKF